MKHRPRAEAPPLATMAACVAVGMAIGWWLRASGGPQPAVRPIVSPVELAPAAAASAAQPRNPGSSASAHVDAPVATTGPAIAAPPKGGEPGGAIEILRRRQLRVPIDDVDTENFKGSFEEHRSGDGGHSHEAVDILAPRNTPIHAVENGTIAKLFESKAGGHTIYQIDPTGRFAYYYAHLERYAPNIREGQPVSAGDVIGFVGTSGNAPPGTPHLHLAIFELGPEKRWWQGDAIDPYLVFRK